MLIPTPYRDAAALFAANGPLPYLWLDDRYLVATDKVQMIVFRLDEEHTGPAVALPLDVGTDVTVMDGTFEAALLDRVRQANEVLGGGQILMQSGAQWQSKFAIGNGVAHVFWMPFVPLVDIPVWEV